MDNHVVVGVGNIYANGALYAAGIHPRRAAGSISAERLGTLVSGSSGCWPKPFARAPPSKDFTSADGKPGYFVSSCRFTAWRPALFPLPPCSPR